VNKPGAVPNVPPVPEQKDLVMQKKTAQAKPANSGTHQRSHPQPEARPILDERVLGLLFDSLTSVQAAIVSATEGMPYGGLRQAMALGEQEKRELTRATQAVVAKHPAFFLKHKSALEFATVLTAINAAHMDHLLLLIDQVDGLPAPAAAEMLGQHVCSASEALAIALIVLAPSGIFALVLFIQRLRRK
jgi:hypothetical protein